MISKKHLGHYLPLLLFLTLGSVLFAYFAYNEAVRLYIAVIAAAYYFLWGVLHHYLHKDLTIEIVIEYLAYAVFGVSVIFSILNLV